MIFLLALYLFVKRSCFPSGCHELFLAVSHFMSFFFFIQQIFTEHFPATSDITVPDLRLHFHIPQGHRETKGNDGRAEKCFCGSGAGRTQHRVIAFH